MKSQQNTRIELGTRLDLKQAAAVIEDDPVKHYCHTCKKYDVALNLGGQCPHCRGDFVELQDKGFWSNVSMEDLITYKLSKNDQRVLGKEEFRSESPSALGPPPGFAQNISSAGDSAADSRMPTFDTGFYLLNFT